MSEANQVSISGVLNYQTVVKQQAVLFESLQPGSNLVDLSQVSKLDSSALAMCLSAVREAKQRGVGLFFTGFPKELEAIADLVDLDLSLLNTGNL